MEDPFESFIKDYSSSVRVQTTECQLMVKVQNFSRENLLNPQEHSNVEYYTNSLYFKNYFRLKVYPDGMGTNDKGYISIYFCGTDEYNSVNVIKYFKFDCLLSVLDLYGSKKFPQTLVYEYFSSMLGRKNILPTFGRSKLLSREALFNEPLEYLPDDTLTLLIEVNMLEHIMDIDYDFDIEDLAVLESAFKTETGPDGAEKYYLSLDSLFAKYLLLASSYFRLIEGTQMTEKSSRYVPIPAEEFPYFMNIWLILKQKPFMLDQRNFDIFQLYTIANKYDFPHVIAACRNILKAYISFENIVDISDLANTFDDVYLKETVENFKKVNGENVSFENIADISKLADAFDDVYLKKIVKNFKKVHGDSVESIHNITTELMPANFNMEWCTKPVDLVSVHLIKKQQKAGQTSSKEVFHF